MKSLIRPGLFATARLALFLAVLSWVLSQFWWIRFGTPLLAFDMKPGGFVIGYGYPRRGFDYDVRRVRPGSELAWTFRDPASETSAGWPHLLNSFHRFGITWSSFGTFGHLAIRHWLVCVIQILFNLALIVLFRSRIGLPADSFKREADKAGTNADARTAGN